MRAKHYVGIYTLSLCDIVCAWILHPRATGCRMVNIVHWREYIARGAAIEASEKAVAAERHYDFWRPPAYHSEFRKVTRTNR